MNTVINYIILTASEGLLRIKAKSWRLILASFCGSLFSLLIFTGAYSNIISVFVKVISTVVLTAIAFSFDSVRELLKYSVFTISVSFIFSGMMIAVYQIFKPPNMMIVNDTVYFEINPLILIAATVLIYIIITVLVRLFRERIKSSVVSLSFSVGGKEFTCPAKIDTGCSLREPFSGSPVIIADESIYDIPKNAGKRVIPYSTVASSAILFAAAAESAAINGKAIEKEIYIARGSINNPSYSAIINPEIIR